MARFLLEDLRTRSGPEQQLDQFDLILTTPSHLDEMKTLAPSLKDRILPVVISPDQGTIMELAGLNAALRAGIVCESENFLRLVRDKLKDIGLPAARISSLFVGDEANLPDFLNNTDVVLVPAGVALLKRRDRRRRHAGVSSSFAFALTRQDMRAIEASEPDILLLAGGTDGATTDFYSNTESFSGDERIVLKGILEPKTKRTVEGDLGMRVSGPAVLDCAKDFIVQRLSEQRLDETALNRYMETIARRPGHIAEAEPDATRDRILAEACVRLALDRHAGRFREAYTPQGKVYVQTGKDLRGIRKVVGSGGFLSATSDAAWLAGAFAKTGVTHADDVLKLIPEAPAFFLDRPYLFSPLGNLADDYPAAAAKMAVAGLEEAKSKG